MRAVTALTAIALCALVWQCGQGSVLEARVNGEGNDGNQGAGRSPGGSGGDPAAVDVSPSTPGGDPTQPGQTEGSGGTGGSSGGSGGVGGSGFRHPGVIVNAGQLAFLREKISASASPWKDALAQAEKSSFGSLSYEPKPRAIVECGSYSNPDNGCTEEKSDSVAAYTHALLWALTGDRAHADKAIQIMNAWSAVLQDHTNSNAPLQSAWTASQWARAAEIIRHTGSGWAEADMKRFATLLEKVYLPEIIDGSGSNGNWELSMIEATMGIGVFLEDRAVFDKAVKMWRERVPAFIYLASDGPLPVPPPRGNRDTREKLIDFWYKQEQFEDGLAQETCRDFGHTQYGLAAIINAAETARIQGVDLYAEQGKRIAAGLEFHAQFLDGVSAPSWLCEGKLDLHTNPTWEIGYNQFANRGAMALPHTRSLVLKNRPTATDHHMAWETLTHAEVDAVGLP